MIKTISLLYKIDLRQNKIATSENQQVPIEDKILIANEAILKLVNKKIGDNNPTRTGFESNKKRYHDLQSLIESPEDHELTFTAKDKKLNKWASDISAITPSFLYLISGYLIADKGDCKDNIIIIDTDIVKHADVNVLLKDKNHKPSFEYQSTFSTLSSDNFEIYTDGTFDPKKGYISYIRYPKKIDFEGYEHFDGTGSTTVDSDLPEELEGELLDIIQEDLAIYLANPESLQGAQLKLQANE